MKKRIVIAGSSFAGYTVALSLAKLLKGAHEIIVIDRSPEFMFIPSLVWHPFGYRNPGDISFNVRPIYNDLDIGFLETTVYGLDPEDQIIYTPKEDIYYDYLVVATGTQANYNSVKGFVPGINAWSICSMYEAERTRKAWKKFLKDPGPIVIGAAQWAGYFFAAYEFLLNALYQLKEHNLLDQVPIHFITAEPYLTHFGIGGIQQDVKPCENLFNKYNVNWRTNAEIHELCENHVHLESGEKIDSKFSMIVPQFIGVNAVRTTRNFATRLGLIHVTDEFRHSKYSNIYAAGGAVSIPQKEDTFVPCGVPRTRNSSEVMAKTVAYNLASDISGGARISVSVDRIYEYCKQDMDHLNFILFGGDKSGDHDLDFIAKGSQEKWANMSIEQYIEASFDPDHLRI
ncbi:MAG: NAD(P)/FAD-dependent oxidoreductase [Balneola sp.]